MEIWVDEKPKTCTECNLKNIERDDDGYIVGIKCCITQQSLNYKRGTLTVCGDCPLKLVEQLNKKIIAIPTKQGKIIQIKQGGK